jgi:hypothetical protein
MPPVESLQSFLSVLGSAPTLRRPICSADAMTCAGTPECGAGDRVRRAAIPFEARLQSRSMRTDQGTLPDHQESNDER